MSKKPQPPDGFNILLVNEQTGLPALCAFGHARFGKAQLQLMEHSHQAKIEFLVVVSGIQKIVIGNTGYTLYGNDVFVTKPGEGHFAKAPPQLDNEILWFQIDLSQKAGFLGLQPSNAMQLYKRICQFDGRKFQLDAELVSNFVTAFSYINSMSTIERIKGQSLFIYCLLSLLEAKPVLKLLSDDIDFAKQYILTHVEEPIDIDTLTGNGGLSTAKFKQKFKEQIGMSTREFVNFAKVHSAKTRIANTNDSISDIAYDFSFSSVNHFKMVFKQYTGYSPKAYRKKR